MPKCKRTPNSKCTPNSKRKPISERTPEVQCPVPTESVFCFQDNLSCAPASLKSVLGLVHFLWNTEFHCKSLRQINAEGPEYMFRLKLKTPFHGKHTVLAKHAKSSFSDLDSDQSFDCDPNHVIFEAEKMIAVRYGVPPELNVTVPGIYHIFSDEKLIIMEDFESNYFTLENLLQSDQLWNRNLTEVIGRTLGLFLAWLHSWSTFNPSKVLDFANQNKRKEDLVKGTTSSVLNTLLQTNDCVSSKLRDPSFKLRSNSIDLVLKIADSVENDMLGMTDILIIGYFHPRNILVELDPDQPDRLKRLIIPDWGYSTTGVPGFDLGMMSCQIHLSMSLCDNSMAASWNVLRNFIDAYTKVNNPSHSQDCLAKSTLAYWGMNLVWMTPGFDWIDDSSTQTIVEDGVNWLLKSRNAVSFEESIVQGLLSIQ